VRAVARDLGERLGTGAHLKALRRTRIGPFAVTDAVSGDELHDAARMKAAWLEPAQALPHLPRVRVGDEEAARIRHGQAVPLEGADFPEGTTLAVLHDDELLCVATSSGARVRPRKVFGDG
jgi:tRNA pseudouridine55 synthase